MRQPDDSRYVYAAGWRKNPLTLGDWADRPAPMAAITNHPAFPQPTDPSASIWRYLDFAKFVSFLDSKALFFARADTLNDGFEGSVPKRSPYLSPEMSQLRLWLTQCTFVNCWHLGAAESVAMWKLYSKSETAVAIRSTYQKLVACLPRHHVPILVGTVTYIDYDADLISDDNTIHPFMHKRTSFQHEHEIRALIQDLAAATIIGRRVPATGVLIEIDPAALIEEVYLAPGTQKWFAELVEHVCTKYSVEVKVVPSHLDEKPIF